MLRMTTYTHTHTHTHTHHTHTHIYIQPHTYQITLRLSDFLEVQVLKGGYFKDSEASVVGCEHDCIV
jgi:hypothetical protein